MNEREISGKTLFKGNAAIYAIMTLGICILFAGNSTVGLIWRNTAYPVSDLYNSFYPNDYINLFLGVPILVLSVLLSLKHSKIGVIGWTGSLLFVLYNDIAYLFAVRHVYSLILNAVTVLLCLVTLALIMTSIIFVLRNRFRSFSAKRCGSSF